MQFYCFGAGAKELKVKDCLRRNKHCIWLLYMAVYTAAFYLAEKSVVDNYWVSYMPLDDKIPFVKEMVFPYIAWYVYMYAIGMYLLLKDPDGFRRYMITIAIGYSCTVAFCFIFPNGQNLRPEITGDDFASRIIANIYSRDTNTNVLPSMHVLGTLDVVFAVFYCRRIKNPLVHTGTVILAVLICASTVMIKQHSILDVIAALIFGGVIYVIVYVLMGRRRYPDFSKAKVIALTEGLFFRQKSRERAPVLLMPAPGRHGETDRTGSAF